MSWTKVKLGDYVTIVGGGTPKRSNLIYWGNEIAWATVKDLKENKYLSSTEEGITHFGVSSSATNIVRAGTVITATRIGLGKVTIASNNVAINQDLKALYCKPDLHPEFLYYFLLSSASKIKSLGKGATVKGITLKDLNDLTFTLPPLEEQKRISEVLDKADRLRQKDRQLLAHYDQLLQSVFLDMFGDPVKNEKGWEVVPMVEKINSIRYGTGSPPIFCKEENGTPFIRATNIKSGKIVKKGMVYIDSLEGEKIAKCKVKEDDLLIVRSGANTGDCARVDKYYDGCYAGYDLIVELDKPYSYFYNYMINSSYGKLIIEPLSRRAGQPHLNAEQVKNLTFICPNEEVLYKFVAVSNKLEVQKELVINSLIQSENLLQSLLQKAFKGELQLKDAKSVEEVSVKPKFVISSIL